MIRGISSMATREVLAELAEEYRRASAIQVAIESIGGVDAARRVRAGEAFDLVVLADDALALLESDGHVVSGSRVAVATSGVAVAVRAGAKTPDMGSEDALRSAVLDAASIGYSTGPSGAHVLRLFERWGIAQAIAPRLVKAPPGLPVGGLVAAGRAEIGFQQLSELVNLPGIRIAGPLPPEIQAVTTFSGGICSASERARDARACLEFLGSPANAAAKRRHGMEPPA